MEIDLRIVLVLVGIIVIAVIVWDGKRKKKNTEAKADEFNQDTLDEMMDARDLSGFDLTGVGTTRIIGDDEDYNFDEPMTATRDDDLVSGEPLSTDDEAKQETDEPVKDGVDPELIITISILARAETGFVGERLLHCMLSRSLRFGDMNIFHRHKSTSGEGPIQFSLANALKPGTFNLDDMSSFQTKGITFFMMLPGPKEPLKSYKLMLETAQYLAAELDGQLVDGSRSVLTQQTIQHFNEQIQDFERRNIAQQ